MTHSSQPDFDAIQSKLKKTKGDLKAQVGIVLDAALEWRPYFWIGIYKVEGTRAVRVDFRGPLPPCHEFEFGKGNVGTTAMTGLKKVIPDVSTDSTYAICFTATKSEIVLPIWNLNKTHVVGVLDAESDEKDFFTEADSSILSRLCSFLSLELER